MVKKERIRELFYFASFALLGAGYYVTNSVDISLFARITGKSLGVSEKPLNILCLILARPNNTDLQNAIVETWGKDCTNLVFLFGNHTQTENVLIERQSNVYSLILPVEDHFENTWLKIRAALRFIGHKWTKSFDWLMRIDDDAFVIFENLKKLLAPQDPDKAVMFGAHYANLYGGYIGTGPGIVLSRGAFGNLMMIFDDNNVCETTMRTHDDDMLLGFCLRNANVSFGKSSDELNRPRYISISLFHLLNETSSNQRKFFADWSAYPVGDGLDCCADELIALHYTTATDIRLYFKRMTENPKSKKNLRLFVNGMASLT